MSIRGEIFDIMFVCQVVIRADADHRVVRTYEYGDVRKAYQDQTPGTDWFNLVDTDECIYHSEAVKV
jgi:hypothetical protein